MEFDNENIQESGEEVEAIEAETVADVPTEYVCPKCNKTYKRESALVKHVAGCDAVPEGEAPAFEATDCEQCGKTYKRQAAYEKHIASCTGPKVKVERVPMTDEEKAAKRKEYVSRWVEKNVTIQIRLLKGGDDLAFVDHMVDLLRESDESAGWATYFRGLLAADKKKQIKKGVWERPEE